MRLSMGKTGMRAKKELLSSIIDVKFMESIPVIRPFTPSFMREQAREFNRIIQLLRRRRFNSLILDLTGCERISSEGLGVIAACWHWCHELGRGRMAVVLSGAGGNEVINLFDITGLTTQIGSALQRSVHSAMMYLKKF